MTSHAHPAPRERGAWMRRAIFAFFLVSGFCSLVYEVVWLRLAYAAFGINAQVMSVVISVFMAGLALGSWLGGAWIGRLARDRPAILFYAAAEAVIGCGAFAVPVLLEYGRGILLAAGPAGSAGYLALSAALLAVFLVPWCVAMGTTYPFAMQFLRQQGPRDEGAFGFLYLANVVGAMLGTVATAAVLVELAGFRGSLRVAAALNFCVAGSALAMAASVSRYPAAPARARTPVTARPGAAPFLLTALFVTGFTSMGMEVAWIRDFAPVLGNEIYSFAWLLATYLLATWTGSAVYRRSRAPGRRPVSAGWLAGWAALFASWPVLVTDPRLLPEKLQMLASIAPFCFVLGYLTPRIVDAWSGGDPARAGRAYAVNIVGSILGPLAVSYLLLPLWGAQAAIVLLAVPYLAMHPLLSGRKAWNGRHAVLAVASAVSLAFSALVCVSFDTMVGSDTPPVMLMRDHSATVVACGKGLRKRLFVNGSGVTCLTPVTKIMAHLPMACLRHRPSSAAVICLGMGTTFRSMTRWGVDTTAVELSPSVRRAFGFFHPDGPALERDPRFRIVVDDGRRFLARTRARYDVITVDPPPPVEAAGSSLLYSREFYRLALSRLHPRGILQAWIPPGDDTSVQATLRALVEVFPHVRAFKAYGGEGLHFLASPVPIDLPGGNEMPARMPAAVRADLAEWKAFAGFDEYLRRIPGTEVGLEEILNPDAGVVLTDDRPWNEYYLLRRLHSRP